MSVSLVTTTTAAYTEHFRPKPSSQVVNCSLLSKQLGQVTTLHCIGAGDFHRSRIGILRQLHLKVLRLTVFTLSGFYILSAVSRKAASGYVLYSTLYVHSAVQHTVGKARL